MAKKQDSLEEMGKALCASLHFNPTSNSTKPLYVANSLFRATTGIECNIEDLHEWIVSERRAKAVASEEIVRKYGDAIINCRPEMVEDIKEARFYLEKLFNPDSTVYPSYPNSVLNIPSKWLVRSYVKAEQGTGEFLYNILNTPIDGQRSPAIDVIEKALGDDDDDLSRTIKPLIVRKSEAERIVRKETEGGLRPLSESELIIRAGFDRLAKNCEDYNEKNGANSLLTLRRIVSYAMFACFFFLEDVNRTRFGGEKIPLLLDADGKHSAVSRASEACFIACKKAVESYTVSFAQEKLKEWNLITDVNSEAACLSYVNSGFSLNEKNEDKHVREVISRHVSGNCRAGDPPLLALAKAIQFGIYTFTYPDTTPSDFCNVLGGKAGLVGPSGNAAKYKRFLINRFLLETIVLSAVNCEKLNDGIELRELGEALRDSYNIIIGTNTDMDYAALDTYGIASATPENLRGELAENAKDIADMLISMGLAKRYADGVTLVGWGL